MVGITHTDPQRSLYRDLGDMALCLDVGSYHDDHPYFTNNAHRIDQLKLQQRANKGVLGLMKDEAGGDRFAVEGVFLKAKLYSISLTEGPPKQACKGITKNVVKNKITIDDYRRVVDTLKPQRHTMRVLRSQRHQIYMLEIEKNSLSLFDDKRYAVDRISTLPFSHPSAIA